VTGARLPSHPIYVDAPPYSARSGGVRALYLLCHHLNALGYEAYIAAARPGVAPGLNTPLLDRATARRHRREKREPIVVYPEVTAGNPRNANIVVRYLLNRPGRIVPGIVSTFEDDDYFLHYAQEHALPGMKSLDLFLPLVDRSVYHPPSAATPRHGFVIYAFRARINANTLPDWLAPAALVSMDSPRSHGELAALYRQSRALVTFERGTAMLEALHCGCPVICIEGENLRRGAYQGLFGGAGLVWGWDEDRLPFAAAETEKFRADYAALAETTSQRVDRAFQAIAADIADRARMPPPPKQRVAKALRRARGRLKQAIARLIGR
jgi:hypothetical protein